VFISHPSFPHFYSGGGESVTHLLHFWQRATVLVFYIFRIPALFHLLFYREIREENSKQIKQIANLRIFYFISQSCAGVPFCRDVFRQVQAQVCRFYFFLFPWLDMPFVALFSVMQSFLKFPQYLYNTLVF
jgi:hypothetical protein